MRAMSIYRKLRTLRRLVGALLLTLYLPACGGGQWKTTTVAPAQFIEQKKPDLVRVSTDSAQTQLHQPRVENDVLIGVTSETQQMGAVVQDTASVPLADIRTFEYWRGRSSTGLIAVVVVALVAVIALSSIDYGVGGINLSD